MLSTAKSLRKPPPRPAAGVANLLLEVVPGLMRELRHEARGSRSDALTIPQFRILAHLGCQLASNNKGLADSVGVSVPATSRMVDLLVKRGLVERVPGKRDKREIELRLSPLGNSELEGIRASMRTKLRARLEKVPAAELAQAEQGLKALQRILLGAPSPQN